jgi:hypothetical protein
MSKKLVLLSLLLLALVLPLTSHSATVNYDSGTVYNTTALTGFQTYGNMMDGMSVTAYFVGGGSSQQFWADTTALSGGVTGTGWSLSQSGDTFGGDWTFSNTGTAISRLVMDGVSGDTIFDIDWQPYPGTDGSANGWTFDTNYTGNLTATYRNILALTGNAPVGDLYTMLDLNFGPNGFSGGNSSLATNFTTGNMMTFKADTDSAATAGDIKPVPEPITLLLLGLGLVGIAGAKKAFKK